MWVQKEVAGSLVFSSYVYLCLALIEPICIYCHWGLLAFRVLFSFRHLMIPYQPHCPRHWGAKTVVAVIQFPSPKSKTIVAVRPSLLWHLNLVLVKWDSSPHPVTDWCWVHPRCVYCVGVYCICICEKFNCETTKEALLFCGLFCGSLLVGQTVLVDFN